jgi:hypothetical protein
MRNAKLMTGVALAALLAGAPAAFAQVEVDGSISQNVTGSGPVSNVGTLNFDQVSGRGASESISATGALAAVSARFIDAVSGSGGDVYDPEVTVGSFISQTASQSANVTNQGTIEGPEGGLTGEGTSASISATGAATSTSVLLIHTEDGGDITVGGNIAQNAEMTGNKVTNEGEFELDIGGNINSIEMNGLAASLSISATGAVAAVSGTFLDADGGDLDVDTQRIEQSATNTANITNGNDAVAGGFIAGDGFVRVNDFADGASVSVSGTGAATSVSVRGIDGDAGIDVDVNGNVVQSADNSGFVSNRGGTVQVQNGDDPQDINGTAASVSIGATGAVASVSALKVGDEGAIDVQTGDITQSLVINRQEASVTNEDEITLASITGDGASASISAMGAAGAVSATLLGDAAGDVDTGVITQDIRNRAPVNNNGTISGDSLDGNLASASISGSGAVASISGSSVGNSALTVTTGSITQSADNSANVTNSGSISGNTLAGAGTSAAISATGAAASVSYTNIL